MLTGRSRKKSARFRTKGSLNDYGDRNYNGTSQPRTFVETLGGSLFMSVVSIKARKYSASDLPSTHPRQILSIDKKTNSNRHHPGAERRTNAPPTDRNPQSGCSELATSSDANR
jgi:hypothetical protein